MPVVLTSDFQYVAVLTVPSDESWLSLQSTVPSHWLQLRDMNPIFYVLCHFTQREWSNLIVRYTVYK